MKIQTTRSFERDYARLSDEIKERVDKQLALLMSNPRHPSFRLKRLRGTADLWEVRITRGYRLTLQFAGELCILRRVGTHDILDR
jgi:mRNA-degrading endonuclease RelE of RelBE toxin-antitoxin system